MVAPLQRPRPRPEVHFLFGPIPPIEHSHRGAPRPPAGCRQKEARQRFSFIGDLDELEGGLEESPRPLKTRQALLIEPTMFRVLRGGKRLRSPVVVVGPQKSIPGT